MKWIKRLEIYNALGIKEFQLSPGKITLIQGENETGKTSILEGIEKVLYNRNRRTDFVRKGEKEATLYAEITDGTQIDKKVLPDGEVRGTVLKDGVKLPRPETLLKSLVGEYAFNPVDFLLKTDKEQTEILLSLIPIRLTEEQLKEWTGELPPVDLNKHAIDILEYLAEKYFYDKRTTANAELKDVKNQIKSLKEQLPDNYNPKDWKDINLFSLHEKIRFAQEHNNKITEAKLFIEEYEEKKKEINRKYDLEKKERIDEDAERISEIENEISKLKEELAGIKGGREEALKEVEENRAISLRAHEKLLEGSKEFLEKEKPQPIDDLLAKAEEAEKMKGYINLSDNLNKLVDEEKTKDNEAKRLDMVVDILRKKPAELMKEEKMPVKGMGINDEMQITIDDLPIMNLSTSKKIRTSIEIARATTGELGLICVDRFETLDKEHKELFIKEIENDEFQYFITEVTEGPLKVTEIKK